MNQDFLDLLTAFNDAETIYLIVGAYAVGVHGHPRATKDLDVWVDASPANALRVMTALRSFGAPLDGVDQADFERPGTGFMMGQPPRRIDVLTEISGVDFQQAWPRRVRANFADVPVHVIGFDDLLANKQKAGRDQDIADIRALERLRRVKQR